MPRGILLPLAFLLPVVSLCQQLPIRSYTVADGLAEDRVNSIVADSRGYVWIATAGGLSRFDGYQMKTYGVEDGLPYRSVNALLETPSGAYLIGTLHGLCRLENHGAQPFTAYPLERQTPSIEAFLMEPSGRILAGTLSGLFEVNRDMSFRELPLDNAVGTHIAALARDRDGDLWISSETALEILGPHGALAIFQPGLVNQTGATLINDSASSLNNESGATLINQTGATLTNNGTFYNAATVLDSATINGTGAYTQNAGSTTVAIGGSFTQGTLELEAGGFTDDGSLTITGNATNSSGSLTINGVTMTVDGTYSQTCNSCLTLLNHGVLDPPAIDISGGIFGGSGEVDGNVTLTGDSTLQAGGPAGGQLLINGDYSQSGGDIVFDIASNGSGGFVESSLDFSPGSTVGIDDGAVVEFDFIGGADPAVFAADGLFNIDKFFTNPNLLADFPGLFSGDSFEEESNAQTTSVSFDSSNGDLTAGASGAPEPGTPLLLAAGLGALGFARLRRRSALARRV